MSGYLKNIKPQQHHIDLDFWKNSEGISVPDDERSFLLVPDAVELAACMDLAKQVHAYQEANRDQPDQITKSLMVTVQCVAL